jgi:hypothetical protein
MTKRFALPASQFRSLTMGRGSCLASDRITVDDMPVGFMYREPPDNELDSGWRFFCGDETQEYTDIPENFELYDVNTIANYDPLIIQYLDAPYYSAFERHPTLGKFLPTAFPEILE